MEDATDDVEEPVEGDVLVDEEELDDLEPSEEDLAEATVPPAGAAEVESIQDLLAKQETATEAAEAADDDETAPATLTRDDRLEPSEARVVPMQATEFMCKRCYLVKHRSQLADKKKMLCRDCA
jgi:hypothetical protein